jgi:PAS domain S-box-containing protein
MKNNDPQDKQEITTDQERQKLFLRYVNRGWLIFGIVTLVTSPFFPEMRRQFVYLVAITFPAYLIIRSLNLSGRTQLAGVVFTIIVNFGFYGLFLVLVHELGAQEAVRTQATVWLLMGLAVLFAGALVNKWAAPVVALFDTFLLIGTRSILAPASDPRPSAMVFWWLIAITTWLYERTLQQAFAQAWNELAERKQTEQALRESERRYRLLAENVTDVIWTVDMNLQSTYTSPSVKRMRGYETGDAMAQPLEEALTPASLEVVVKALEEELAKEKLPEKDLFRSRTLELEVVRKDGSTIWVETKMTFLRDPDGKPVEILGVNRDITERKRAEGTLRDREEHYRTLFEHLPIPAFTKDREGRYTSCNAENQRYWAVSPLGQTDAELLDPEKAAALREADLRVMETGDTLIVEEFLENTPLGERQFLARKVPLRDARGNIVGILGASVDITERKRAEEEIRRRADEFAALYKTARDLAAQHDLPTLLNTIVERARALLHAPGGGVYLYDPARGNLEMILAVGTSIPTGARLQLGEGMAGRVAKTHQPLIVDDYRTWEGRSLQYEAVPIRAVVEIPMLYAGELIGVLVVHEVGESERKFTQADVHLLSLFAEYAAGAVHATRLLQETRRRAEETTALLETSLALTSLDLETTMQTIGHHAKTLFAADGCRIFLMEPDGETLRCVLALQESPVAFSHLKIKIGEGVTGAVAASGQAEIVNAMQNDPRAVQVPGTEDEQEAIMFAPLKERGHTLGVISIRRIGTEHPFYPADLELLQAFAAMAASSVSNAHLFEETQRRLDELETLQTVSAALRQAHTVQEMLPIFVKHSAQAVGAKIGSIYLYEEASGEWVSQGWITVEGEWIPAAKDLRHRNGEGVTGRVGESGEVYILADRWNDPVIFVQTGEEAFLNELRSAISLPLHAEERIIGVMHIWYANIHTFTEGEKRLLTAVSNMAGSALQRARLHEETQRRLERLSSLQNIEQVITSSLDLRLIMNILLGHILQQLKVDAAAVLLYQPELQSLEFVAGQGFHTQTLQFTRLRLGEGLASRVALERRIVQISDLDQIRTGFLRSPEFQTEGFVAYIGVPLIAKGNIIGVLEIYHRQPLEPDREWMEFLRALGGQAAIAIDNTRLFEDLQSSNLQLRQAYDATIEGWAQALEMRDMETVGHSHRAVDLTLELARMMGIEESQLAHVRRGALLHDIGKMGVPDAILQKSGSLTEEEWEIMRQHPLNAYTWLAPILYLQPALDIPSCHHEKWDGSGYPRGLKGEQIPLAARIFAVVDVWDALTSDRPYRKAWSKRKALDYIEKQSGKHFDPVVVETFLRLIAVR